VALPPTSKSDLSGALVNFLLVDRRSHNLMRRVASSLIYSLTLLSTPRLRSILGEDKVM
jgi:hypothetical protein